MTEVGDHLAFKGQVQEPGTQWGLQWSEGMDQGEGAGPEQNL